MRIGELLPLIAAASDAGGVGGMGGIRFGQLIPLIGAVLNFSLALYVLIQNPRAPVCRVYFLLGVCFAIWNFGTFQMFRVEYAKDALFWARFLQCGVIFIPLALCHVSFIIAQIPLSKAAIRTAYAVHLVFLASNFTKLFVEAVKVVHYKQNDPTGDAWYCVGGIMFWIWSGIFFIVWTSIAVLINHRRKLPPMARRRLTPLIVAQTALALFGGNDLLPILGIDRYPYTGEPGLPIYPFGSMAVIFYGVIVGYSVLQYQLLDVRVTLNRGAAKAVRVLFIFLAGLCVLLVLWLFKKDAFSFYSFFAALGTLMFGAICAAVLFPKLFGESSETVERRILGDTFEYQDQVRKFIESMTWYSDMNLLLNDLHELFTRVFQLGSYFIIMRDETSRLFELVRTHPAHPVRQCPELRPNSPVFRYFEWTKGEYLPLDADDLYTRTSQLARQSREQLASLKARFCFPLASEGEIFGLLLVGNKTSEQFTANDISLIITLVKSMSLMVNQIRLKTQILQSQELDLLGKMSRGMAHDLNNLLTPVWTLLQISSESGHSQPLDPELLPVALRNVQTMSAYIKEALFFSENLRPDLQLGRLDLVVRQAASVAIASRKKDVPVTVSVPGEELVEMDEVLIQRLIANLISNAIDASRPGAQVRVELEQLGKTDAKRDWLRVRVVDQGEGIPKENLSRILMPYFTTKNRGDENRGFGLGLAICRKIVNLHGGHLSIASQQKKGTTVQVDLPSRQIKQVMPQVATSA